MRVGDGGAGGGTGGGGGGVVVLRFSLGVTRVEKVRNECIGGTVRVGRFGEKTREAGLGWYGHVRRRGGWYIGRGVLGVGLPGGERREAGGRFVDVLREDVAEVEVTEEDTQDGNNWRWKIHRGDP